MVNFDVAHVFRVFGGPRKLLDLLDRHQPGHGLNYNQVQMWARRQVPGKYIGAVLYTIIMARHDVSEFLTEDEFVVPPPPPGSSGNKTRASRNARPGG
jgi:hypothetical protein